MERLATLASRLFMIAAFAVAALAVGEGIARIFGQSLVGGGYSGGRLLEFSAILMVFAIALILRSIRNEVRRRGG